jgi:invasion protein IalB
MTVKTPWYRNAAAATFAAALLAAPVHAQDDDTSDNRVAAKTDWSVFVDDNPKECWSVSTPKEIVNTRDGRVVAARRGQILLMVFYRPEAGANGQVAFTGGYPFGSPNVTVDIGGNQFELFTDGEWAWPATPADDARLITAMKRGAEAVVTAVSSRGTETRDTFSLLGFTAAVEDASARCSS